MIAPFFAAILGAVLVVFDKYALSTRKISLKEYVPYLFLYLFFFSALLTPFFGSLNADLFFMPTFLFLFLILIVLAISHNIFYYDALRKEKLYEFETILIFAPLVTIVLSWIFFPESWDPRVGAAALIAAAALIWSHWEKHHFSFSHYSMNLLVAVVMMSTEEIVVAELLRDGIFSPISLYALRTLILFIFFFAYYRPVMHKANKSNMNLIALIALLGGGYMVLRYYGYRELGVTFTSLVTIAAPITVYIASATVMHERIKVRSLVAAAVVAAAIIYATSIIMKA